MSLLLRDAPLATSRPEPVATRDATRLRSIPVHAARLGFGVLLCTNHLTAIVASGWTFRLMRRRVLRGWWSASPMPDRPGFAEFLDGQGPDVPAGPTPRWFVAERFRDRLRRPGPAGRAPGVGRCLLRLPGALMSGLFANVRAGLVALACTAILTLPGGLSLLGGWEYGWNISFYKGYEQAFVGRSVGLVGMVLLALAMLYVPMAWAHLAATGDPRAFFQFRFVGRLIRGRLGVLTLYAATFSLLTLPATASWLVVQSLPNLFPWLADATPEQLREFAGRYSLATAAWTFPAFVLAHVLAARIYRGAVLGLLRRDPAAADALHPTIRRALDALGLLPAAPARRPHPLIAVVLVTGRRGTNAVLWVASFLLWLTIPAQMLVSQFFVYHPFLVWLNPVLILVPSLPLRYYGGAS